MLFHHNKITLIQIATKTRMGGKGKEREGREGVRRKEWEKREDKRERVEKDEREKSREGGEREGGREQAEKEKRINKHLKVIQMHPLSNKDS